MLTRMTGKSGVVWYQSPLLAAIGTPHGFSTRLGGVSPLPFDSLNMGNPTGCAIQDSSLNIEENYRLLQAAIGTDRREVLRVHQVHAEKVVVAGAGGDWDTHCKADAIIAIDARHMASVRVADCVPVLMAAEDGAVVAAVHAGWRGVIAGVVSNALAKMRELRPGQTIFAAIGPCIGMEAFEVGAEVLEAFASAFGRAAPIRRRPDGKGHVDLRGAIALQLASRGVGTKSIDSTDRCTFGDADEFFSHRRDNGVTGRMTAMIGAREAR